MRRVYMDHSATTPVDATVLESMLPYFRERYGNASSLHTFGQEAKGAIGEAREQIAQLINADEAEIIFTSGGTEANNTVLKGVAYALQERGNHIIISNAEHPAVLRVCEYLEKNGFVVTCLPVDQYGMVEPEAVKEAITDKTILISIMHVNNEVGTINPIEQIGAVAREHSIYFHTDAIQSVGKIPVDVEEMNIDFLSISAHKIYGPKGVGAVYARKGLVWQKFMHGGGHENNRRAGTQNVAGIVGFGKAAEICARVMVEEAKKLTQLRQHFWQLIQNKIFGVRLNGHPSARLPGNLNISFENVEGEALLLSLDIEGIAVSSGSACSSGTHQPSHVLQAMGLPPELAAGSLRFTLGRSNTMEDVEYAAEVLTEAVARLRQIAPAEV